MPENRTVSTRVLSEDAILQIVPTLPYRTSCALNWSGIEVHRYRLGAGESKEHSYPQLAVFVPHADAPYNIELTVAGATIRTQIGLNSVSVVPPYLPHSSRRDGPGEMTAIFLDPALTSEIAMALTGVDNPEIVPQIGINDPLIRSIGIALDNEMASIDPCPRIYAESLAMALGAHIFGKYAKPGFRGLSAVGLHGTQLRRGIEFMKDNLGREISLTDLAAAAGMSKYHFAKSFKLAMGSAPHQYLVRLRLEKARKLLAMDNLSVEEIAGRVGYSDKAHFAAQFRKNLGVSPSYYRRTR